MGDIEENSTAFSANGVTSDDGGATGAGGAVAVFIVDGELEDVIDNVVIHHGAGAAVIAGIGGHGLIHGGLAERRVERFEQGEAAFEAITALGNGAEVVVRKSGDSGTSGRGHHRFIKPAEEFGSLQTTLVKADEGRQKSRSGFFPRDDGADMRRFAGERRVLRVGRLHVELAAFVSGFPAGGGADEQQIVKVAAELGEESIRERKGAGLADIGVGSIPGTVLRIEGVQVAGAAV